MWELTVEYRTKGPRAYKWGSLDEPIRTAARGVGSDQGTMVGEPHEPRDMSFQFRTIALAQAARRRVKALGRVTRTDIHKAP